MTDVAFKTTTTRTASGTSEKSKPAETVSTTEVEVPYLDYEKEHGHPYTVGHFALGDTWKDPVGGFPEEVGVVESYFKDKISSGEMANSVSAVKDRLKEILKVTNMSKEERNLVKVETVAAYIKFLKTSDDIKRNVRRYAGSQ